MSSDLIRPPSTNALEPWLQRLVVGLFVVSWVLVTMRALLGAAQSNVAGWPEAVFLFCTALVATAPLIRELPLQNLLLACAIVGAFGTLGHLISQRTGVPFGPIAFAKVSGIRLIGTLFSLWVAVVFVARGTARWLVPRRRSSSRYGYWLLGVTVGLTVLFALVLEPFATHTHRFWFWHPTRFPLQWQGTPASSFLGWGATTALALLFATPALVKKRPGKHPPALQPVLAWCLLNVGLAAAALRSGLWGAVVVGLLNATTVGGTVVISFRTRSR